MAFPLGPLFFRAAQVEYSNLSRYPLFNALAIFADRTDLVDEVRNEFLYCVERTLKWSQPDGLSTLVDRLATNRYFGTSLPSSVKLAIAQRTGDVMATYRIEGQSITKPEHVDQNVITQHDMRKLFFAFPRLGFDAYLWKYCRNLMKPLIEARVPDAKPILWAAAFVCVTRCNNGQPLQRREVELMNYFFTKRACDVLLELSVRGVVLLAQALKDMRTNQWFTLGTFQDSMEIILARLRHSLHEMRMQDCITILHACFRARLWNPSQEGMAVIDAILDKIFANGEPLIRSSRLTARLMAVLFSPVIPEGYRTDQWRKQIVSRVLKVREELSLNEASMCLWQLRSAGFFVRRGIDQEGVREWTREVAAELIKRETEPWDFEVKPVDPMVVYELCKAYVPREGITQEMRRIAKQHAHLEASKVAEFEGVAEEQLHPMSRTREPARKSPLSKDEHRRMKRESSNINSRRTKPSSEEEAVLTAVSEEPPAIMATAAA